MAVKVLVSAASRHGATVEVAANIGAALQAAGHEVFVLPRRGRPRRWLRRGRDRQRRVRGQWLEPAKDLVARHKVALSAIPVWLFSSGPSRRSAQAGRGPGRREPLAALVGARDHRTFPGHVDRRRLGFGERALMAVVRAPEGDYRPWDEIEAWAREIAANLTADRGGPGA